ncbi:MAG TPA: rubrerythrin family protein, partial [Nitrolancea sp.]|nr:rubrerythrin family protein [Nitrolancea sp.]
MAEADIERYRKNLQAEIDGVALYRALEDVEQSPELSEVYRRFTESELRHAAIWRERLCEAGAMDIDLGERPSWRTRVLIWMARRLGPGVILPTVIAHEQTDSER